MHILENIKCKIYDKRDDFDFDILKFPFLDGGVPRRASLGVYISQLIRLARVCNHVTEPDFSSRDIGIINVEKHFVNLIMDSTRTEQLTKCYEPLQKLRVRLGSCKTGLSPPIILYY